MTYKELAANVREKYPGSYDDLDDKSLATLIVEKYPQYADTTFDAPSENIQSSTGINIPASVQKAAEIIETPQRGMRALGVGVQKLIEKVPMTALNPLTSIFSPVSQAEAAAQLGLNAPEALERAAEATKPGFEPQEGEKLGSFIGETVGSLPLATAATGVSPAVTLATPAKLAYQIIRSGVAGGALTGIHQAANIGAIRPGEIAKNAGISSVLPMIKPGAEVLRKFIFRRALPPILQATAKVPEEATRNLLDDPKLLKKYKGTEEEISSNIIKVQAAILEARKRVGDILNKAKERIGVNVTLPEKRQMISQAGSLSRSPKVIMSSFEDFLAGNKPPSEIDQIRVLIGLRQEIDDQISFTPGVTVPKIQGQDAGVLRATAKEINDILDTIPKARLVRMAERGFSEISNLYDQLQKDLSTTGTAEQVLEQVFRGKSAFDILGKTKVRLDLLDKLDKLAVKQSGKKVVDPLFMNLSSQAFKRWLPRFGIATPLGMAGTVKVGLGTVGAIASGVPTAPAVAVGLASLSPRIASKVIRSVQSIVKGASSPAAKILAIQQLVNKEESQ